MSAKIVIHSALICDQVRVENNNKLIFLGIYSGNISLRTVPSELGLTAILIGEFVGGGDATVHVKLSVFTKGETDVSFLMESEVEVESVPRSDGSLDQLVISLPPMHFPVTRPMTMKVEWSLDKENWRTVLQKGIDIG